MSTLALALDSKPIALEILALLRELDPARWSEDLGEAFRRRLAELSERVDALLELPSRADLLQRAQTDPRLEALRRSWARLAEILEQVPAHTPDATALQSEWEAFRRRLQAAYEGLVEALRNYAIHLPHLRPTNYGRNVLHAGSATAAIAFVQLLFAAQPHVVTLVAAGVAALAWTFEISRRYVRFMDRFTWWVFGRVAHPHERKRVNSATWFSTSLLALALTGSPLLATVALAVMGFADPAAALIGRRWGRIRLLHGRSLEGSLSFLAVGTLLSLALLRAFFPELSAAVALGVAAAAAGTGAAAELVAKRVDDNVLVPLAAASGAALAAGWLHVAL